MEFIKQWNAEYMEEVSSFFLASVEDFYSPPFAKTH